MRRNRGPITGRSSRTFESLEPSNRTPDVVLLIYREDRYNPQAENEGMAEIIVAKQRNGPTDTVKLAFIKERTRFENYDPR